MDTFLSVLRLEFKKFHASWNMLIWGLILVVSFIYTNQGINDVKTLPQKEKSFKEIQDAKFSKIQNYLIYSLEGITSLYKESACSTFFRNTTIPPDTSSNIDGQVSVNLTNNLKSKTLDPANLSYNMDFSGLVLLMVSIYAIYLGYNSIRIRGFLRFLLRGKSAKMLYTAAVLCRFFFFALYFSVLVFLQLLLVKLRGVTITAADFAGFRAFLYAALVMLFIFYCVGVLISMVEKTGPAFALMAAAWFVFIYMVPGLINSFIIGKIPDVIEEYRTDIEKFQILTDFDEKALKEHGVPRSISIDEARLIMEGFKNNELVKIEDLEKGLKNKCMRGINKYAKYALFSPVTFYLSTGNEVSSRGYKNFVEFYDYAQKLKHDFFNFYVNEMFYEQPKKVRNFLEVSGSSNIFYAQSRIPDHFAAGILVNLGYAVILLVAGYFLFDRAFFPKPKLAYKADSTMELHKGKITALNTVTGDFKNQVRNILFGRGKFFPGRLLLDEEPFPEQGLKSPLYLPEPDDLPDEIRGIDLLLMVKRIYKLDKDEFAALEAAAGEFIYQRFGKMLNIDKFNIMLAVAELKKWHIYIVDHWVDYLLGDERMDVAERLQQLVGDEDILVDMVGKYDLWLNIQNSVYTSLDYKSGSYKVRMLYSDPITLGD